MIKLGLNKIIVTRRDPSPSALQALSETVAWCFTRTGRIDQLRSHEFDPSAILKDPRFENPSADVRVKARQESYRRATTSINELRSTFLHRTQMEIPDFTVAQTKGKLLRYEPLETVGDVSSY